MEELLRATADRAIAYRAGLAERGVAPTPEAIVGLSALDEPLPQGPGDPAETMALLDAVGSPATVASAGPRFFGFVIGGSLPVTLAANWLAGAWDQDAGAVATSPACAAIELVAHRWLLNVLGLPPTCASAFVTGGTMANFSALAAARHAVLSRAVGMSRRTGCSAPRRSRSLSARRCMPPSSKRSDCSASGVSAS